MQTEWGFAESALWAARNRLRRFCMAIISAWTFSGVLISFSIFDRRTASALSTILLFIAVGAFIYSASRILIVFLLAILFAYLLEPLVFRLEHSVPIRKGSRSIAILAVYIILCAAIALAVQLAGPKIVAEGSTLAKALPGLFQRLSSGQLVVQMGSKWGWSYATQSRLQQLLANHSGAIIAVVSSLGERAAAAAQNVIWIVLIPILAIFFLKDGRSFSENVVNTFESPQQRRFLSEITDDLNEMLAHYIRSQIILAGLSLVAYMAALSILQVPYALALASVAGIMEFVPLVGPLVGAAAILGVALLAGYHHFILVAAFLVVWRIVQDYVTTPRVMGNKLQLHPLTIIFAVLAGGEIAGVIGVYLSIPIAATLRIVWKSWQREYSGRKPDIKVA